MTRIPKSYSHARFRLKPFFVLDRFQLLERLFGVFDCVERFDGFSPAVLISSLTRSMLDSWIQAESRSMNSSKSHVAVGRVNRAS